ncbi:Hypothetical protein FKW44_013430 [Caligus rogercresseyi]|uniref:Uncharacterized protein n=1 Tax=Caligus rogercresseyi TaxID=217165 RepID=A0A7T8HKV9_CALRO|nr:Hypothetical protein FKW44_013430 [Caligus rogercresseyi]
MKETAHGKEVGEEDISEQSVNFSLAIKPVENKVKNHATHESGERVALKEET